MPSPALAVGDQRGAGVRLVPGDAARRARRGVLRAGRGRRRRLKVSGEISAEAWILGWVNLTSQLQEGRISATWGLVFVVETLFY